MRRNSQMENDAMAAGLERDLAGLGISAQSQNTQDTGLGISTQSQKKRTGGHISKVSQVTKVHTEEVSQVHTEKVSQVHTEQFSKIHNAKAS